MKKIFIFSALLIFSLTKITNISNDDQDILIRYSYDYDQAHDDSGQTDPNAFNDQQLDKNKKNNKNEGEGNVNMEGFNNQDGNQIIVGEQTNSNADTLTGNLDGQRNKSLEIQNKDFTQNFDTNPAGKFKGWMRYFYRNYRPQEQRIRFSFFKRNIQLINAHNYAERSSYFMEANKFADLSDEQFIQLYLMAQAPKLKILTNAPKLSQKKAFQLLSTINNSGNQQQGTSRLLQKVSETIDWRKKITFAPIKDQGKCASCYAFATIAAVQLNKALMLTTKKQLILSQQQIVDCCKGAGYNCNGCSAGNLGSTFNFLANKGIATALSYPYIAAEAPECKLSKINTTNYLRKTTSYYQLTGQRYTLYYLLNKGPLAVTADATTWKLYKNGTFDGCKMEKFNYTHAITLIGVEKDYWSIRNSWGKDWGQNGHIRLKRGGNPCGILTYVFYPLVV